MPLAESWPRGALFPVVLASGAPAARGEWFAYAGRGLYGPLFAQTQPQSLCSEGSGEVRVPVEVEASSLPLLKWMAEDEESSIGPGLYRVEGSLLVPEGHTLRLRAGTMLFFEGEADLVVDGTLLAEGLAQAPVLLGALDVQRPWGGVVVRGKAVLREIFLETGGGHVARNYGHSQSHPVLDCQGGEARASHAWIILNAGKGIGGAGLPLLAG